MADGWRGNGSVSVPPTRQLSSTALRTALLTRIEVF